MPKEKIAQIWPEWEVEKLLGKGSYGEVYQVIRRDDIIESRAAIKVISIPTDSSEIDSLRSEGLSMDGAKTYFKGIVNDFVDEIRLMESLKGVQNIVSVEDYKVIERTNEVGWDIYIRMELLKPFNNYICEKQMNEKEVIKLGIDICTALEICSQRNIVHRDIKPENIFINDFGYFKLGDFGIARKLENATGGLSQKGTFNYMAPEVANGTYYDARVDIYSLGIVLYRLLNGNRLPFIENEQQLLNPNDRKNAVERRIRGEQMKAPCDASSQIASVILRACAFNPDNRFKNATEMKEALQKADLGVYKEPEIDLDKTVSVRHANVNLDSTMYVNNNQQANPAGRYQAPPHPNRNNAYQQTPPVNNNGGRRQAPPPPNNGGFRPTPPNNNYNPANRQAPPPNNGFNPNATMNGTNNSGFRPTPPPNNTNNNGFKPTPPPNNMNNGGFRPTPPNNTNGGYNPPMNNGNRQAPPNGYRPPVNYNGTNGTNGYNPNQPMNQGFNQKPSNAGKKVNWICQLALISCLVPIFVSIFAEVDFIDAFILYPLVQVLSVLPVILAIIGRGNTRKTNTKGNGTALGALIYGLFNTFFGLAAFFDTVKTDEDTQMILTLVIFGIILAGSIFAYRQARKK